MENTKIELMEQNQRWLAQKIGSIEKKLSAFEKRLDCIEAHLTPRTLQEQQELRELLTLIKALLRQQSEKP